MGSVVDMNRRRDPRAEPGTFDEIWFAFPKPGRKDKPLCRAKYEAITGLGLQTNNLDRDSGGYQAVFLQATHEEILEGVLRYDDEMLDKQGAYGKYKPYVCNLSTFLNRGRWEQ